MICRLPGSILHKYAKYIFSSPSIKNKSWFQQIRDICLLNKLPHPLHLMNSALPKPKFKKIVQSRVFDYWEITLRKEASPLSSLKYFNPAFMSLKRPHPIWSTVGSSPAKVAMATVQAQMLSGRYRTQHLCSLWSQNTSEYCKLSDECATTAEDIEHILKFCPGLSSTRKKLQNYCLSYCENYDAIKPIVEKYCDPSHPQFCQFLLDCSIFSDVIKTTQLYDDSVLEYLFTITRTFCYNLHKERLKILGRWNYF